MVTRTQKRALWQHDAIEPVIGHMKADGFLGWNFLKGAEGDKLNALLCWVGQNLRAILRYLRVFFVSCLLSRVVPRSRLVSPPRAHLLTKGFFRNNDLEPFNHRETVQKTYSPRGRNKLVEGLMCKGHSYSVGSFTLSADTKYGDEG